MRRRNALVGSTQPLEAHGDHEQEVGGARHRDAREDGAEVAVADPLPGACHDQVERQCQGPKGVGYALVHKREVVPSQALVVAEVHPQLEQEHRHGEQQAADNRDADTPPPTSAIFASSFQAESQSPGKQRLRGDASLVRPVGAIVAGGAEVISGHSPQRRFAHRRHSLREWLVGRRQAASWMVIGSIPTPAPAREC